MKKLIQLNVCSRIEKLSCAKRSKDSCSKNAFNLIFERNVIKYHQKSFIINFLFSFNAHTNSACFKFLKNQIISLMSNRVDRK